MSDDQDIGNGRMLLFSCLGARARWVRLEAALAEHVNEHGPVEWGGWMARIDAEGRLSIRPDQCQGDDDDDDD